MATRYNENFKIEVVKAYMAGDRSISEIAADYNVAKSTHRWEKNMVKNANIKLPLKHHRKNSNLQRKSED